ncbi:MAG: hypothetical protein JWO06_2599 [Bacteroidota bacterium]|nr:hypothetical protein [Bacteroidota bacterium]
MKLLHIAIILLLGYINTTAQAPNWLWAKGAGGHGPYGNSSRGIATDRQGNSYITGEFSCPVFVIGSDTLLPAAVNANVFIAKYDANGNEIWAKRPIGNGIAYGISLDGNGNVYITGQFFTSMIFDHDTLSNPSGFYIFVAKYDSAGNELWVRCNSLTGALASNNAYSISADNKGNVYATGEFSNTTITFGSYTLTNSGSFDFFIVKYDSVGNVKWAKKAGGSGTDFSQGVSIDGYGNAYVAGSFGSSSITFGSNTLTNNGANDVFITKYDTAGNVVWAKAAGGAAYDIAYGIATDKHGNSCITGIFASSTISFGPYTVGNNSGNNDYFIAKYDSAGNAVWASNDWGSTYAQGLAITVDEQSNAYVTGGFEGTSIVLGTTTLYASNGVGNFFVAKYDTSGNVKWAKAGGGIDGDAGQSISTDASGNVYLVGDLTSPSITLGNTTIFNYDTAGGSSIFITKIAACVLPTAPVAASQRICAGNSTVLSATGTGTFGWYSANSGGTYLGSGNSFATPVVNSPTTFYVQDSTCQPSIRTAVTVTVNPKPTATITPLSNDTLTTGSFSSYQWLLNGSPISGATGASYVTVANGNYQVAVVDSNGCMDTSAIYSFILLGVAGTGQADNIHLYPNPSTGLIYCSGLKSGETLEIYNVLGEFVYAAPLSGASYLLDMSANAKSIYLYRITDNHLIIQQGKIVLE